MSIQTQRLDRLLRTMLGPQAEYSLLEREQGAPTTFALAAAEQMNRRTYGVVWVKKGPLTMSALRDPADDAGGIVVVSERMVELSDIARGFLVGGPTDEVSNAMMEYTFFKIVAEESLSAGKVERAIKALAMAIRAAYRIPDSRISAGSTGPVMSEAQMATCCFALLHEVGHLESDPDDVHQLTDGEILDHIEWAVTDWLTVDISQFCDPRRWAMEHTTSSVIGVQQLRAEIEADLFATYTLMRATFAAMQESGKELDPVAFVREAQVAQHVVVIFDRLRRSAALQGGSKLTSDALAATRRATIETVLQPVAMAVRGKAQQAMLSASLDPGAFVRKRRRARTRLGSRGRRGAQERMSFVLASIAPFEDNYAAVDEVLNATTDFILNQERYIETDDLLEELVDTLRATRSFDGAVRGFTWLADQLGRTTEDTTTLQRMVARR